MSQKDRLRWIRPAVLAALLVSVGTLAGLGAATHVHHDGSSSSRCVVCRWASETTPDVAVTLVLLPVLEPAGTPSLPPVAARPAPAPPSPWSRGPPLS